MIEYCLGLLTGLIILGVTLKYVQKELLNLADELKKDLEKLEKENQNYEELR